jgi:hypothetical protein
MAITVNTNLGGRKTVSTKGLKIVQCELTLGATADFPTTGLDLSTILTKVGLKGIVAVISANKRTSGGTGNSLVFTYIPSTSLLLMSTTGSNTAIGTAQQSVANDVLSLTLLGY